MTFFPVIKYVLFINIGFPDSAGDVFSNDEIVSNDEHGLYDEEDSGPQEGAAGHANATVSSPVSLGSLRTPDKGLMRHLSHKSMAHGFDDSEGEDFTGDEPTTGKEEPYSIIICPILNSLIKCIQYFGSVVFI